MIRGSCLAVAFFSPLCIVYLCIGQNVLSVFSLACKHNCPLKTQLNLVRNICPLLLKSLKSCNKLSNEINSLDNPTRNNKLTRGLSVVQMMI